MRRKCKFYLPVKRLLSVFFFFFSVFFFSLRRGLDFIVMEINTSSSFFRFSFFSTVRMVARHDYLSVAEK